MLPALWNVQAAKLLNGGRLIAAPVAKRLARRSGVNSASATTIRILDLGGQASCDWAWYVASTYTQTKVYTLTTTSLASLSNAHIRGPGNHRTVITPKLTRLPFRDSLFDLVSAREVYSILKDNAGNGEDEWAACLRECMRVLKPGGYLEFRIMDAGVVNAGPLGLAKSVEFGFKLKRMGYDPAPTKLFLGRLRNAGFVGVKRAWVFLPMGAKNEENKGVRDSMGVERRLVLEAVVQGSSADAASVAGLVGTWAWEKWLLRCGDGESEDWGVQDVVEEGRACGAGWRVLSGWARKPL